ncbi:MAG: YeeE/YedE family protein [Dehalococcoidia bacterium]|nr:YeeE/YedE family protein [Dehalococcoidia bacterium]
MTGIAAWKIGLATLFIGIIVGYLGQRSRFCTISGIRDFFLVRDAYRLKGLIGVFVGAVVGFALVNMLGGNLSDFKAGTWQFMPMLKDGLDVTPAILIPLSAVGAFFMAYFSVMAEGCPFRQHVMAGEGRLSGIIYLTGLLAGVVFFNVVVVPYLQLLTLRFPD